MTRSEAIQNGEKFFDASPCRKCGCTKRYTASGMCKPCNVMRVEKHRNKIKEAIASAKELRGE